MHPIRPKRRYLVVSEFITACLEESTLLDEEGKLREYLQTEFSPGANRFLKDLYPDTKNNENRVVW